MPVFAGAPVDQPSGDQPPHKLIFAGKPVEDDSFFLNRWARAANRAIESGLDYISPRRKEGMAALPAMPATAPSRGTYAAAPEAIDPRAAFEKRKKLEADLKSRGIDPRSNAAWRELVRQQAVGIAQEAQEANLFLAPTGKGIAGLVERGVGTIARRAAAVAPGAARTFEGTPLPAEDKTGLATAGKDQRVSEQVYDLLWAKAQRGEITEGGAPSTILHAAKVARDFGALNSRTDLKELAQGIAALQGQKLPAEQFGQQARQFLSEFIQRRRASIAAAQAQPNVVLGPVLGERNIPPASREAPPVTPEEIARSRAAARTRPTEILRQVVPGARREPPDFTEGDLARSQAERSAQAERRAAERDLGELSKQPVPKRPTDLIEFLARNGGVIDQGGELRALDAHRKFVPASGMLVRTKGGMTLDGAREAAAEAGYIHPDSDISDLLSAIADNLRGVRRFSDRDETAALQWQEYQEAQRGESLPEHAYLDQLQERAHQLGIRLGEDATPDELLAEIHEREAIMAEGSEAAMDHADHIEAEIDQQIGRSLSEGDEDVPFEHETAPIARGQAEAQPTAPRGAGGHGGEPAAARGAAPGGAEHGAQPAGGGAPAGTGGGPGGPGGVIRQPGLPVPPPAPRHGPFVSGLIRGGKIIEKIFSPTTVSAESRAQEALTRQNIGLAERETQQTSARLEQFRRQVNAMSVADKLAFLEYVEGRSSGAVLHDPALQELADALRGEYEKRRAALEALPSTERATFIEDYFVHIWKNPEAAEQFVRGGNLSGGWQGSGRNLKKRLIPTIADGIRAGLEPVTLDPIRATMMYVTNMNRYIAVNRIFDTMRENGTARYFQPGHQPGGWAELKGRLAEKAAPISENGARIMKAYAPADAARIYNNFISRGWRDIGENAGTVYDAAQRTMNSVTMAELSFSAFHASVMANEAVVSGVARGIGQVARGEIVEGVKSFAKAPAEPVLAYGRGKKFEQQYLGLSDHGKEFARIVDLGTEAGMRVVGRGREYFGSTGGSFVRRGAVKRFFDAWRRGAMTAEIQATAHEALQGARQIGREAAEDVRAHPLIGPARQFAHNMARLMDTVAAPLFDHLIPRLKAGAFYADMRDWIVSHPAASRDEQLAAARMIWDSIDNRFGELVMDDLFWNRMLKQSLQLTTRSVGWDLGTVRELVGGAADIARGKGWGKDMSPRAKYVIALPIVTATANSVLQYLKTGKPPGSLADLYAYRTGGKNPDGSDERAMIPGYMKDVLGWIHDPIGELWGKASTGVHLVFELLTNRDFRNLPIGDPNAGVRTAEGLAKLPGFLLAYLEHVGMAYVPIQYKMQTKAGSNISTAEKVLAIRRAPGYLQNPEGLRQILEHKGKTLWHQKENADERARRQAGQQ